MKKKIYTFVASTWTSVIISVCEFPKGYSACIFNGNFKEKVPSRTTILNYTHNLVLKEYT